MAEKVFNCVECPPGTPAVANRVICKRCIDFNDAAASRKRRKVCRHEVSKNSECVDCKAVWDVMSRLTTMKEVSINCAVTEQ